MKFRHLLYPLALYIGFNYAAIIASPTHPSIPQYLTISQWKQQLRLHATQIGTDIPIKAKYTCKMVTNNAWTCDYRTNK